jgi:uncharacterized protein
MARRFSAPPPGATFTECQTREIDVNIPGPSGPLEAVLSRPVRAAGTAAVLCHPHPLYGGTMHDAVLECLARVLVDTGVTCLRFNFRGVGASAGRFSGGAGELDDLAAAVDWIAREERPARLWLGGYSFGAHVVWQAAGRALAAERMLLVAPPNGAMAFAAQRPPCPVDAFFGSADAFVDAEGLAALPGVTAHVVLGADHFFTGVLDELEARIRSAIAAHDPD